MNVRNFWSMVNFKIKVHIQFHLGIKKHFYFLGR